jgi:flavorubredoxin
MRKVAVVYTTNTGETGRMAEVIAAGAKAAGGEAELFLMEELDDVSVLEGFDALAVGSPTEEAKEVPAATDFLEKLVASKITGKYAAAFGSYGWSGEAPYIVALKLERECGMKIVSEPLKFQAGLKDTDLDVCRAFGMKMVFGE